MEIQEKVAETIAKYKLLTPGQMVITGVSGGADSLCLLFCLRHLGYQVVIAHLDHQLREESAMEALFVKKIGKDYEIKTILQKGDVRALSECGYSIEEAARLIRYQFLVQTANKMGVNTISTGHTADDQIETVLMHLLRGAGPAGLRGILPDTRLEDWVDIPEGEGIHLVRPLLEISHSEAESYCQKMNLKPVYDPSNVNPTFFRNKIRYHLIPYLREYNQGIENIILRMAKVMEGEVALVESLLKEKWSGLVNESDVSTIVVNRDAFLELPIALKRSFLRRVIKELIPGIRDIGFTAIDRAIDFIDKPFQSKQIDLLIDLQIIILSQRKVIFRRKGTPFYFSEYPQLRDQGIQRIAFPLQMDLQQGWSLTAEKKALDEKNPTEFISSLTQHVAAIDSAKIRGEVGIRSILPGDRIKPLGLKGHIKVSELFINCKIPRQARSKWPLVVDDEKVIWVVGLRIADQYRITPETREILFFQIHSPKIEVG